MRWIGAPNQLLSTAAKRWPSAVDIYEVKRSQCHLLAAIEKCRLGAAIFIDIGIFILDIIFDAKSFENRSVIVTPIFPFCTKLYFGLSGRDGHILELCATAKTARKAS